MAKRRRKRRAHRVRGSTTARSKAIQREAGTLSHIGPFSDRDVSSARVSPGNAGKDPKPPRASPGAIGPGTARAGTAPTRMLALAVGRSGRLPTALLPGRVFFAMDRPLPGLVCCVLQASLLGWLPAAIWALRAERRVAEKQRGLAARLRPL